MNNFEALFSAQTRTIYSRIMLLNQFLEPIESLEGVMDNMSITVNGESIYRRSGSLSITLTDENRYSIIPSPSSKIWFNSRIKVMSGILNQIDGKIVWFNLGVFAVESVDIKYANGAATATCELKDLMAFLDGSLGGRWTSTVRILPDINTPTIREGIRAILAGEFLSSLDPIYQAEGVEADVPFMLQEAPNGTRYNLIRQLINLYRGYEFFFDDDGFFIVQRIPNGKNDSITWTFDKDQSLNLVLDSGFGTKTTFSDISNAIYVIGKQLKNGYLVKQIYTNRFYRDTTAQRNALTGLNDGDICYTADTSGDRKSWKWNAFWSTTDPVNAVPPPWDGTVDTTLSTAPAIIEIYNGRQLARFRDLYNTNAATFNSKEVRIMGHINLGGRIWLPISSASNSTMYFNGNGYTIMNLSLVDKGQASPLALGFFGRIAGGSIKNLGLKDVFIVNSGSYHYGMLAGIVVSETIENISLENFYYNGGFLAHLSVGYLGYVTTTTINNIVITGANRFFNLGAAMVGHTVTVEANTDINNIFVGLSSTSSSHRFGQVIFGAGTNNNITNFHVSDVDVGIPYSGNYTEDPTYHEIMQLSYQQQYFEGIFSPIWSYKNNMAPFLSQTITATYQVDTMIERDALAPNNGETVRIVSYDTYYIWNAFWSLLNFNVVTQFNVESIGYKNFVITDTKLSEQLHVDLRAEYELEQKSRFNEKISFESVPIYSLNVNNKIYVNLEKIGAEGEYLITSINFNLGASQSMRIEATKIAV